MLFSIIVPIIIIKSFYQNFKTFDSLPKINILYNYTFYTSVCVVLQGLLEAFKQRSKGDNRTIIAATKATNYRCCFPLNDLDSSSPPSVSVCLSLPLYVAVCTCRLSKCVCASVYACVIIGVHFVHACVHAYKQTMVSASVCLSVPSSLCGRVRVHIK